MGLRFDEFEVGKTYLSARRTIRESDIEQFAALSGDYNPLHVDELYIKENTNYRQCIAHGALTFAISTGFSFQDGLVAGTTLAFLGVDELRWKHVIYPGDTIRMQTTVLEKKESKDPSRGIVTFQRDIINQDMAIGFGSGLSYNSRAGYDPPASEAGDTPVFALIVQHDRGRGRVYSLSFDEKRKSKKSERTR